MVKVCLDRWGQVCSFSPYLLVPVKVEGGGGGGGIGKLHQKLFLKFHQTLFHSYFFFVQAYSTGRLTWGPWMVVAPSPSWRRQALYSGAFCREERISSLRFVGDRLRRFTYEPVSHPMSLWAIPGRQSGVKTENSRWIMLLLDLLTACLYFLL